METRIFAPDAASLTGTISSARFPGGVMPTLSVKFIATAAAATWTSMPAAVTNFAGVNVNITKVDLTNYSQGRLIVNKGATAGADVDQLFIRYQTSNNYTAANFLLMGASEIATAIDNTSQIDDSGWINLVAGAKADVYIAFQGSGGDGATSPAFGAIEMQFR